jgi:hypothetical protein
MGKTCNACDVVYERGYFSQSQWTKPAGTGRCKDCVNNGRLASTKNDSETARQNESSRASFENDALRHPFSQGAFRWVAKGKYVDGPRNGQDCVCKWFKDGHVMEQEFFDLDIKAMHKALDLVQAWNSKKFVGNVIKVNMPAVWQFYGSGPWAGNMVLQEPFILNYQKFNSNSGWADSSTEWPQLMQALSHFSYHTSAGQFVLCDLQGGIYSNGVILTDPVILSRNKQYGITDLGPEGISSFFSNHTCNQYCRSNWSKPADRRRYHAVQMGTSMAGSAMPPVPKRHSRPAMSAVNEYY